MATDKERLLALLSDFGISFTQGDGVTIEAKVGDKVKGYTGFCADFMFTPDGEFVEVGIWE